MPTVQRFSIALLATVCLAVAAPATGSPAPKAGVYQGIVKGTTSSNGHNEGEGYIRLKGKKIVAPKSFSCEGGQCEVDQITAPSWFGEGTFHTCDNQVNAVFDEGTKIKVKGGSFDYSAVAHRADGSKPKIEISGKWSNAKTIKGFTRFRTGGCKSEKLHWTMKLLAG